MKEQQIVRAIDRLISAGAAIENEINILNHFRS